jgi:hypothetical protein
MPEPPKNSIQNYRFGYTTNTDLLAPVNFNLNPLDIKPVKGTPPSYVWEKWRYFNGFVLQNIDLTNTYINSEEGKEITVNLIKEFNTNPQKSKWAQLGTSSPYRGLNSPITREDIFAIQRFHQKTDSKVIVDGWLGTQTLKLNYPNIEFSTGVKPSLVSQEKVFPVIWGNKRYVISSKSFLEYKSSNPTPKSTPEYLELYDPTKHDSLFAFDPNRFGDDVKTWVALGQTTTPNASAEKVNSETVKKTVEKEIKQLQTKLKNSINGVK